MPQTISISPKFFVNERNNYSSWGMAFWRELFQNSVDAGASRIDINVVQDGDAAIVEFEDNGCGMSKDVRDNVYFRLGETTKTGDEIGGFARARILTCFSHRRYEIWSEDWHCIGSGSEYDVYDAPHYYGCKVRVEVDATTRYNGVIDMEDALKKYLSMSQLACYVTINGKKWSDWGYRRTHVKNLSFGKVYTNKSAGFQNTLLVRVSGALMYTRSIRGGLQVVVEVDPSLSRRVLISNRDSMNYEYQDELDQFIQSIVIDTKSALSNDIKEYIKYGNKKQRMYKKRNVKAIPVGNGAKAFVQDFVAAAKSGEFHAQSVAPTIGEQVDGNNDIDDVLNTYILWGECSSTSMRKSYQAFRRDGKNMGGKKRKLLMMWYTICQHVIEVFLDNMSSEEYVDWQVGFLFSDKNDAMHWADNGIHALLLRPVGEDGKLCFNLRSFEDRVRMITLACHEVAHLDTSYHDERYASVLTSLISRVFAKQKEIMDALKCICTSN